MAIEIKERWSDSETGASEGEDTPNNQGEQEKAMICFIALDEAECRNIREMEASTDKVDFLNSILKMKLLLNFMSLTSLC